MAQASLNFVTFNQDHSCLAVGTSKGFRIFHTEYFSKIFSSDIGNIALIEMLFSTSLVAVVTSPRNLEIKNTKRDNIICQLTFPTAILAVRLNRKRLAVILEDEIYLYDISNMTHLFTIPTSPNPSAICSLSPSSENAFLAYPLPKPRDEVHQDSRQRAVPSHAPPQPAYVAPTSGEVLIFDTLTLKAVNVVEAHRAPLSCIALNSEGTLMATASEKGTIIRVFSVPKGQKLYQFRRGTYPTTIYNMSFNLSSTLLCVTSTSDTVHIFRLGQPNTAEANEHDPTNPLSSSSPPGVPSSLDASSLRSHDPSSAPPYDSSSVVDYSSPQSKSHRRQSSSSGNGGGGRSLGNMLRRSSQLMTRGVAGVVNNYLPQSVSEMWEPARDFAFIKLPKGSSSGGGGGHHSQSQGMDDGEEGSQRDTVSPDRQYGGPEDDDDDDHRRSRSRPTSSSLAQTGVTNPLAVAAAAASAAGSVGPSVAKVLGAYSAPLRSVVAMSSSSPHVMVITSDGGFYVYHIDMQKGGEGFLVKQHSILDGDGRSITDYQ